MPADRMVSVLAKVIRVGFLLCFWFAVYGKIEVSVFSYFLLVSFLDDLVSPDLGLAHVLEDFIHLGILNSFLIRPGSPVLQIVFENYGRYLFYIVTTGIPSLALAIYFIKPSLVNIALFFVYCVVSFVITICLSVMVATFNFWGPIGEQVRLVSRHCIYLISGYMIPLTFFSSDIRRIFDLLPFRHMISTPIEVFQGKAHDPTVFIVSPIVWMLVLIVLAKSFWKFGLKRYEGVGI